MGKSVMEITVVVDTNDGNYLTEATTISEGELKILRPLLSAIGKFKPYTVEAHNMELTHEHNYPNGENYPRTDLGEKTPREIYRGYSNEAFKLLEQFAPCGNYGFHTIDSVVVRTFTIFHEERFV